MERRLELAVGQINPFVGPTPASVNDGDTRAEVLVGVREHPAVPDGAVFLEPDDVREPLGNALTGFSALIRWCANNGRNTWLLSTA